MAEEMGEYEAAEALEEIERTQQKAYARQRLPLWYMPGLIGLFTLGQIGVDAENPVVMLLVALVAVAGVGVLLGLLFQQNRVRWTAATWTLPAAVVSFGWVVLVVAAGVGVYAVGGALDEVLRKALAGGVAMVVVTVTTRPVERLVLRYSKGRVVR